MKRMQYCWYCGKELGVYDAHGEQDTCGARECERAARDERAYEEADRRARAEEDRYERYRS